MGSFPSFLLLLVTCFPFFCSAASNYVVVWSSSFETNVEYLLNTTVDKKPFERVSYASISAVPPQDGDWAITAKANDNELILPQIMYYGGDVKFTFYAYTLQACILSVRFLTLSNELISLMNITINNQGWSFYQTILTNYDYQGSSAFLVSLMYSGPDAIYLDSFAVSLNGNILSCSSITKTNRCGFVTDGIGSSGWSFGSTNVAWGIFPNSVYLKRDFKYFGGLIKGSVNFKAISFNAVFHIEIGIPQSSFNQIITSGSTTFDFSTVQLIVGKTYTISITSPDLSKTATLSSLSLNVGGNCGECHPSLLCNTFPNGVSCECQKGSCGTNQQCNVIITDRLANPCSCLANYVEESPKSCVDINECTSTKPPCTWNSECINTNGSFYCSCLNGWTLSDENNSCTDINECTNTNPPCTWNNSLCINTNGSFSCSCLNGWTLSNGNNSCTDVNECAGNSPACSWSNGICVNKNGSFDCLCVKGWMLGPDKNSCIDLNECKSSNPPCSWSNGVCENSNGSFGCSCAKGWILGKDNNSCVDLNECASSSPACSWTNGVCANTNGSFICSCMKGWMLGKDNNSCIDIDECASNSPPCSWTEGVCANTNGSYVCSCSNGWIMGKDNNSCVDVNECSSNNPPCSWNKGVCTNTNGSFVCTCLKGWLLGKDNNSCIDVDECASNSPPCSWSNGVCANTNGSFNCFCMNGWMFGKDNNSCIDINECASNSLLCSWNNGVCINTNGSYTCSCTKGWVMSKDNNSCVDINECTAISPACAWINGVCTNTNGSFYCSCVKGWVLNKYKSSCVDFDECAANGSSLCPWVKGTCINTYGSYKCSCEKGWALNNDNQSCYELCGGCEENKNKKCIVKGPTKAVCLCKNGYSSLNNMLTCEDVDDCASGTHDCKNSSICVNTDGGFNCSCAVGWVLTKDGKECQDVNECLQNKCGLDVNVTCVNKVGTYECICPVGQVFNYSTYTCQDINECLNAGSEYPCDPVRGHCENQVSPIKYVCSCPVGWSLYSNNICVDINECFAWCTGPNSQCRNFEGGYQCMCSSGFIYSNVTHQCEQVNMCAVEFSCPINSTCSMPSPGKVSCQCINGYMMDYRHTCVEIDECNAPNLCVDKPHQKCVNKQGVGIACECWDGYEKVGNFCTPIAVDECKIATQANVSLCKSNQICVDTPSGFQCNCLTGYKINVADDCEDVNECVENVTICQPNAVCVNTNGSYYCKCEKDLFGGNDTDSSLIKCYTNDIWSSWEQIGTCSELCVIGEKQGKLKFRRFCVAIEFKNCTGEYFKEELCNSEFCGNKIAIAKSTQCQTWSNMQDNVPELSVEKKEIWLHKIKAWSGWKEKGCQQVLVSALLQQDIDDVTNEIRLLNVYKNALRNVVDCNSYNQQKSYLLQKYFDIYSRLTMYASVRGGLSNLKSRIDVKLNKCERDSTRIGDYASFLPKM